MQLKMEQNTKQEIEEARKFMIDNRFEEVHVSLAGLEFSYFVLPQSLNPSLPDFVYRCTGAPEDSAVFGISDSVPEESRKYAVAHEVIEFGQIGLHVKGRCSQALKKELSLVPESIKTNYIEMRRNFFRNLIDYAKNNNYSQGDIQEFKASLSELEKITKGEKEK